MRSGHLLHPFWHGLARIAQLCVAATVLVACGGGGSDDVAAPPVQASDAPTAAFSAAATATAHSAVVFDASASTAGDGSALQYAWDFGDGQRGGGATIAHVFAAAGTPTVTLTVVDGAGRSATATRTVTIAAGAAAAARVTVHARVVDLDGVALPGVLVAPVGSSAAAVTTDASGRADIALDTGAPLTLKLSKAGYADQFRAADLPAGAGTDTLVEATMRPRDAPLTLADAHAGGTVAGRAGATLVLPPDTLVNGAGRVVTGAVEVSLTPVDVTLPRAGGFPGRFDGVTMAGAATPIVSLGTVEFVLTQGGERLQLAPGRSATVELPLFATRRLDGSLLAAGDTVPLWSLDEATSVWIQEGSGTVVASADSPSGLALRATVSHFSWWNADIGFEPYGPQPKCVYDTDAGIPGGNDTLATATVCNMLAEIDRGLAGNSAAGRAQALAGRQAEPLPPRVAAYSRQVVLPIGGGFTVPVPAGVDVALQANALNGTWTGRRVVNGPVGVREEVLVKLRPIAVSGPGVEPIAIPFDATRSLQAGQTARFSFAGAESKYARVTAQAITASTLSGQIRLLHAGTAVGTAAFGPTAGTMLVPLQADATYTIEVEPLANAPGGYRLLVELLGGIEAESLTFPFDVTRSVPAYTIYRGSFQMSAAGAIHVALQPRSGATARQLRLLGPDSAVLFAGTTGTFGQPNESFSVAIPAPGTYRFESATTNGSAAEFRVTAESTPWAPVGPGLDTDSGFEMVDLVADRNGRPVVGFRRNPVVNARYQQTLLLRRWSGTAWEAVGSDLTIESPCSGVRMASFAFDSTNTPVWVYGSTTTNGSITSVRRFSAGAWQPLGPNNGVLPKASAFAGACADAPKVVVDAADRPVVAYRGDSGLWLQRFEAGAWQGLAAPAGDEFPLIYGTWDLKLDPSGAPWLVLRGGDGYTTVRRFDAAGPAWQTIGPDGGRLPQVNAFQSLVSPRLRFAADGTPVVAAVAGVGTGGVSSPGIAVYRFDGSTWVTSGAMQLADSYVNNTPEVGFTLAGSDALVAWQNQHPTRGAAIVVQRNGAGGYAPIGSGLGEVVQYWGHGITPEQYALDPRMLTIGSDVYLAFVIRTTPSGATSPVFKVTLLKRVGG